jgi:hypothetical protein
MSILDMGASQWPYIDVRKIPAISTVLRLADANVSLWLWTYRFLSGKRSPLGHGVTLCSESSQWAMMAVPLVSVPALGGR